MRDNKKSKQEELIEIEKRLLELKEIEKNLSRNIASREKSNYRRLRARRLIETGALAEKYFDIDETVSIQDREEIFKMFSAFVKKNKPDKLKNKKT